MSFRYLGFLIILFSQGVNSYNPLSAGYTLAGIYVSHYPQDTVKIKTFTREKPAGDFPSDMVIQVGAFVRESNATALQIRLSSLLNQGVIIVPADGYFKVRVTGCKTLEEMGKLVQTLGLLGIKNVWIFHNKPKEELNAPMQSNADTTIKPINEKIAVPLVFQETPVVTDHLFNLQVGVFHSKAKAMRAQRKIISKLNLPVKIVREWEYYIVFVTGFKTREEIFVYYPRLAALGYPDSFMVDNIKNGTGEK